MKYSRTLTLEVIFAILSYNSCPTVWL